MGTSITLTPDLWKLYNFIKDRSLLKQKTTVKDICNYMPEVYHLNEKQSHFSNCPKLYKDIDVLNHSYQIECIIVKNNNNFQLVTREEGLKYEAKLKNRALRAWRQYWDIHSKNSMDGQGKCISAANKPIDEKSKAREFYKAFLTDLDFELFGGEDEAQ